MPPRVTRAQSKGPHLHPNHAEFKEDIPGISKEITSLSKEREGHRRISWEGILAGCLLTLVAGHLPFAQLGGFRAWLLNYHDSVFCNR